MLPYYYSYGEYMAERFGGKVYKLSLDGGMTCPNRDGTLSTGGCVFCSAGGSGDFSQGRADSVSAQIKNAEKQVEKKYTGGRFVAYFQSYTNTYADIGYLRKLFTEAADNESVVALSIATRPDCLGSGVIGLLGELNKIKPVFVELGLQTIHPKTAEFINRCYALSVYDEAVKNLHSAGINVVVHLIFGLPGETGKMMMDTVDYVVKSGADGIKIQMLQVLKDTRLEEFYLNGGFDLLTMDEYVSLVAEALGRIPKNVVIHRLTGDPPRKLLVAPEWTLNKKAVLNAINREIRKK